MMENLRHLHSSGKLLVLICSALAWFLCLFTVSRCTFFKLYNPLAQQDIGMGLFSRAVYDRDGEILGCVAYTDGSSYFDSWFKIGRAFAMIAALCSSIFFLFISAAILFRPRGTDILWITGRFYVAAATIGQMFSFFALSTRHCQEEDQPCELSGTGKLALCNVVLLAAISIKVFFDSPPVSPLLTTRPLPSSHSKTQHVTTEHNDDIEYGAHDDGDESEATDTSESRRSEVREAKSKNRIGLVVVSLILASWVLSIVSVQRCTLFMVGPVGGGRSDFSGLGLYTRASYHKGTFIGCLAYPNDTKDRFDTSFQAGRVFGVMCSFLMSLVACITTSRLFVSRRRETIWILVRALLPCAALCQMLVFSGLKTDTCTLTEVTQCRLGPTGYVVILNVILTVSLSITSLFIAPPFSTVLKLNKESDDLVEEPKRIRSRHEMPGLFGAVPSPHIPQLGQVSGDFKAPMEPIIERIVSLSDASEHSSQYSCANGTCDQSSKVLHTDNGASETVSIRVEYSDTGKTTTKTVTYRDGAQLITTTVEEMPGELEDDDASCSVKEDETVDSVEGHTIAFGDGLCTDPLDVSLRQMKNSSCSASASDATSDPIEASISSTSPDSLKRPTSSQFASIGNDPAPCPPWQNQIRKYRKTSKEPPKNDVATLVKTYTSKIKEEQTASLSSGVRPVSSITQPRSKVLASIQSSSDEHPSTPSHLSEVREQKSGQEEHVSNSSTETGESKCLTNPNVPAQDCNSNELEEAKLPNTANSYLSDINVEVSPTSQAGKTVKEDDVLELGPDSMIAETIRDFKKLRQMFEQKR